MDSITQFTLGAAIGYSMLGKETGAKTMLWGGVIATLPDLDVFIPYSSPIANFTYHRSFTHSIFVLTALTPIVVFLLKKMAVIRPELQTRWSITVWLVLITHALLDSLTTYGTQIFWPLISTPISISSIFIIDPLYTLPLILGLAITVFFKRNRPAAFNKIGLAISTCYLLFTLLAKYQINQYTANSIVNANIEAQTYMATPTPFNSFLWRVLIMDANESHYYIGYISLFDQDKNIVFKRFNHDNKLLDNINTTWAVQRLKWFSNGFFTTNKVDDKIIMTDLRMGLEPNYIFSFLVGKKENNTVIEVPNQNFNAPRANNNWKNLLVKIWQRIWNQDINL